MTRKQYSGRKRRKGDRYRGPFVRPFSEFRNFVRAIGNVGPVGVVPRRVTTSKRRIGRTMRRLGGA